MTAFRLAALAVCIAAPVAAQMSATIQAAKSAGQVGERYDGYLGMAASAPSSVRREVEAINIRRRAHYANLARARRVSPQEVGITAGCFTLRSVAVGESYMLADNNWRRRGPVGGPPVPSYCRV